jgi:hypothetical protein
MSQQSRLEQAALQAQALAPSRSVRSVSERIADWGLVPDMRILDFVLTVLGVHPYPRQGTLLKVAYLENLTRFDLEVLTRWARGFRRSRDPQGVLRFEGGYGTPADVIERMAHCRALGRRWASELILVMGRRGSKSLLAAICAARMIYELLLLVDPQDYFDIVPGKRLTIGVFAGQEDQARALLFRDIAGLIVHAPVLERFVAARTAGRLLLYSPRQLLERPDRRPEDAVLEIVARESTALAGRGPASPMVLFDEMAHMVGAGANRSAAEIFAAATPALAQFADFSMLVEASSPGPKAGQFYDNVQYALELDATGAPVSPTSFVFQLPSWDLYEDYERTHDPNFLTHRGGQPFPRINRPRLARDFPEPRRRLAQDPRGYDSEFNAQWQTVENAFLDEAHVLRIFAPLASGPLVMRSAGSLGYHYVLHADPARRNANFAAVIAHLEYLNGADQLPHLLVDRIQVWRPADYPSGEIDQYAVVDELLEMIEAFRVATVTVDQYDATLITQYLARQLVGRRLGWQTTVEQRDATPGSNRRQAELFREAIALNLVHSPPHELALQELLHLQEHAPGRVGPPTSGLITTSDVSDCLFQLCEQLLAEHIERHRQLGALPLHGALPGGIPISAHDQDIFDRLSASGRAAAIAAERRGYPRRRPGYDARPGPRGRG